MDNMKRSDHRHDEKETTEKPKADLKRNIFDNDHIPTKRKTSIVISDDEDEKR